MMSAPIRIERDEIDAPLGASMAPVVTDTGAIAVDLVAALRVEQQTLRRDVLLWQRWVRYLALVILAPLALVFSPASVAVILPVTVVAAFYIVAVMFIAWTLGRTPSHTPAAWVPSLQLALDVVAFAALCFVSSAPQQYHRILFLGFLTTLIAVFYFGRVSGSFAAGLALLAYLVCALALPPFVAGLRSSPAGVAFNAILFAIVSAVLIHTFGGFRDRMDALRLYFKVIERGEAALLPPLRAEPWPDDLTLLTRGFEALHARLAEEAGSDALTGCLNRRSLEARLRTDLRQARRRGSTVAIAAIDLDHFKTINDSRGHPAGDLVLQQVAAIMKSTARDTDAVARFGGDEFVVILPDTGWQGALTFADRLRRRVDEFAFGPPDAPLRVTASVGVSLASGSDPLSTDMLLQDADAALYRAKTAGRNRVLS